MTTAHAMIAALGGVLVAVLLAAAAPPLGAVSLDDPPQAEPAQAASCPAGQYYNEACKACAENCQTGLVWDCGKKACVQKTGRAWSDEHLYAAAGSLVRAGHHREARDLLWAMGNTRQPKVLNLIGYTTRQLGDVERGIAYYLRALAIDPDFAQAREYLGEGYLQKGDVPAARAQLDEIGKRCGRDCAEYVALADAIVLHLTGERAGRRW